MEWGLPSSSWLSWRSGAADLPSAAPTESEAELVEVLAQALADSTVCRRCGACLGRRVRLIPGSPSGVTPDAWRLLIVARCRGWRRHPYIAEVVAGRWDLRFGPFC
ncbi:hypothetical protein AB0M47_12365 [Hamadaea sp. NPDC051192]|uniref:hypothetical protein n=1 Tax=Hamadaea sp. NPDC051192 TaxID=3154940 RepID=UPI00343E8128